MASSMKNSLLLCIFFLASSAIATGSSQQPSLVKCIHHHASLITCANYLEDINVVSRLPPTESCCKNYVEIFRRGTPACMCRYLHPERLKTSFNVNKLMSLHELCQSSDTVPLYDLCASDGKFEGIVEIVDRDLVNHPRWINPSKQD